MPNFVLFLYEDPDAFTNFSPEELQAIIRRYTAWGQRLAESGRKVAGQKLHDGTGRLLRKRDERLLVTDGPYAEAREVIGGYYIVRADTFEQAVELASDCPHLEFGQIEIREIEELDE